MNITFLDAKTVGDLPELHELSKLGNLKIFQITKKNEVIKRIKNSEVIITNKVVIDKKAMDASPELKLICVAATGTNNIDMEYAIQKRISVKNVKSYSTESVTQQTFAMLFNLLNHISFYDKYVKSKKYSRSDIFTNLDKEIYEIKGRIFGIIGLGAIGRRVAEIAKAFGAQVFYYSTSGKHNDPEYRRVSFEELLHKSDIISIHSPLNENTKNLIGWDQLKQMKPSSILINAGRGGIVKEKDLVKALNKNIISGAAFDVYEKEPMSPTHPFLKVKNPERLLLSPHIAWSGVEARKTLLKGVYQNIEEFIKGK